MAGVSLKMEFAYEEIAPMASVVVEVLVGDIAFRFANTITVIVSVVDTINPIVFVFNFLQLWTSKHFNDSNLILSSLVSSICQC